MLSVASLRTMKVTTFPLRGVRGFSLPGPPRRGAPPVKNTQFRKADQSTVVTRMSPRAQFRDSGSNAGGGGGTLPRWSLSPSTAVNLLVAANVLVAWKLAKVKSNADKLDYGKAFITSSVHVEGGLYHTLLTSVFGHVTFPHLISDMLGIYVFGHSVAPLLGSTRMLGLFAASGAIGSWVETQQQLIEGEPKGFFGGNAAVSALAVVTFFLAPSHAIKMFGRVPIHTRLLSSSWLAIDGLRWLISVNDDRGNGARLSGAAVGAAYSLHLRRLVRLYR